MRPGHQTTGHPVDVATGVVTSSCVDIHVHGRIPLVWERHFATPSSAEGTALGIGWSTRFFARLIISAGTYRFSTGPGDSVDFEDRDAVIGQGGVLRHLLTCLELQKQGDDYVVTSWDSEELTIERYIFSPVGRTQELRLSAVEDGSRNRLILAYDRGNRLTTVTQQRERRALVIEYSNDLITQIQVQSSSGSRHVAAQYSYGGGRHLTAAFDAHGRADHYEYDERSRLIHELARCGEEYFFVYDAYDRCVETYGPDGYDHKRLRFLEHQRVTELLDSRGKTWRYHWNVLGQVVFAISPRGALDLTKYDEFGRIIGMVDAFGREIAYAYDDAGNRTTVTYPNGAVTISQFDAAHRLIAVTDPLGATWEYGYDAITGSVAEVRYPTGVRWVRRLNVAGDPVTVENSVGGQWRFSYDELGQTVTIADATGALCRFVYDDHGNIVEIVDPEGGSTRYEHDLTDLVTAVSHADGSTRVINYDSRARVQSVIESGDATTSFEYGAGCEEVTLERRPDGGTTQYVWGTEPEQLLAVIDALGGRHELTYDDDGYLSSEVYSTGKTVTYKRDLCGFVQERTNGAGETTVYERDAVGRILKATFHDMTQVSFEYDAIGMVVKATNAEGTVEIARNALGDRLSEAFAGNVVDFEYDAMGSRIARRSNLGASTTYLRDAHGRIVEIGLSPTEAVLRQFDRLGRELVRQFGMVEMRSRYDPLGRLAERSITRRARVSATAAGPIGRRYRYDLFGNLTELREQGRSTQTIGYDRGSHVTEVRTDGVTTERYAYDANENVIMSGARPAQTRAERPGNDGLVTRTRRVGAGNQILQAQDMVYEYDGDGRLIRKAVSTSSGQQIWHYKWNPMGLLESAKTPDGEVWNYHYDAFGRRIRKVGPGADIRYVWDGNSILHEIRAGAPADVVTWTFWLDDFVPVAKQEHGRTYYAITDPIGTPREFVTGDGDVVWSASFLLWGERNDAAESRVSIPLRMQGQWYDEETGLCYNGCRYYAPEIASFISMDPVPLAGGPNAYMYAPNPLRWIDPHGLSVEPWPLDSQGRPTGASGTLTRRDLRPTDSSPPGVDPPGWRGGAHPHHQQRSHLVADTLGGSGDDPRNIIALTDGSNHPGMSSVEGKVRRHIQKNGGPVKYEVRVQYKDNHKTPSSVTITATDKNGKVIAKAHIANGKRQKTGCCP
jgi:RHS repeat-associated protein